MRQLVMISFLLYGISLNSQVRPMANTGGSLLAVGSGFVGYKFGAGVRIKDKTLISLNVSDFRNSSTSFFEGMKITNLSFSLGYRFMNNLKVKSPMVFIDLGIPIWSNADSALVNTNYQISKQFEEGLWRYNNGILFGKLSALYDIKAQAFNIQLGVSFNQWYYSRSNLAPDLSSDGYYVKKTGLAGRPYFGLEAGLMYTIPTKRKEKK